MTAAAAQPNSQEPLTPTELKVLYRLFDFELDYSEIASELGVTKAAVNFHVLNILSKLGVTSRFSAVCTFAKFNLEYRDAFFNSILQE